MISKIALILLMSAATAHEGHDHSQIQAPKGGVLHALETVFVEFLSKGQDIQIYLYDLNLKPLAVTKYEASAQVELPRKPRQKLEIKPFGEHWNAKFDAKGAHRFTVIFEIKQGGHHDQLKYTVEPKP